MRAAADKRLPVSLRLTKTVYLIFARGESYGCANRAVSETARTGQQGPAITEGSRASTTRRGSNVVPLGPL